MTLFIDCNTDELMAQIGTMNVMAISGGRVVRRLTGVTLPVDCGYSVTVDLHASDNVVRRVFKRGTKTWVKGEQSDVCCDEVGEVAYRGDQERRATPERAGPGDAVRGRHGAAPGSDRRYAKPPGQQAQGPCRQGRDQAPRGRAAVDAEAAVLEELAARRRAITGAIREGREGDLDELRAVLRRLFVGFELASPAVRFGSGVLRGQGWVGSDDAKYPLSFDGGYYLLPVLRLGAVDLEADDPAGFRAVRRVPLSDNLCSLLADW
jgi:hypothetical protein